MKIFLLTLTALFLFFSVEAVLAQQSTSGVPFTETIEGTVIKIIEEKKIEVYAGNEQPYQKAETEIKSGSLKGKKIVVEQGGIVVSNENQRLKVGDTIIISHLKKIDGSDQFLFVDFVRSNQLFILVTAFVVAVVFVGGFRGLYSFVGLVISFIILLKYIIPQIVAGNNPVVVAISGSFIILLTTLYLAHGFNRKTTAAVLGTTLSLTITGLLAFIFVNLTRLSGFGSEDASMLSIIPNTSINLQGILLAGIIIGALGVLDDITISQAACVFELYRANSNLTFRELYKRGLHIGQDHIASLVNTLVLAYAGASLPLLILFAVSTAEPMKILINREMIASEIVRTLVGSLGLVSAVPITTAIASYFCRQKSSFVAKLS